jgi:hypothetical protein
VADSGGNENAFIKQIGDRPMFVTNLPCFCEIEVLQVTVKALLVSPSDPLGEGKTKVSISMKAVMC